MEKIKNCPLCDSEVEFTKIHTDPDTFRFKCGACLLEVAYTCCEELAIQTFNRRVVEDRLRRENESLRAHLGAACDIIQSDSVNCKYRDIVLRIAENLTKHPE